MLPLMSSRCYTIAPSVIEYINKNCIKQSLFIYLFFFFIIKKYWQQNERHFDKRKLHVCVQRRDNSIRSLFAWLCDYDCCNKHNWKFHMNIKAWSHNNEKQNYKICGGLYLNKLLYACVCVDLTYSNFNIW